jgi:methylmalonyl-CoA mutase
MARAIDAGVPKMRIEEAAARTQARIDSGQQTIVGLNKYRLERKEQVEVLKVDNSAVREAQIARLSELRAHRDPRRVHETPRRSPSARKRATATCSSWPWPPRAPTPPSAKSAPPWNASGPPPGRHPHHLGVYSSEMGEDSKMIQQVRDAVDAFARREGAAAHPDRENGQDGHDRGQKVVSTPSPTWASTSISAALPDPGPRPPARPSRTTSMWPRSAAWPPVT